MGPNHPTERNGKTSRPNPRGHPISRCMMGLAEDASEASHVARLGKLNHSVAAAGSQQASQVFKMSSSTQGDLARPVPVPGCACRESWVRQR